jgi:Protein of unknown function (DUF3365)
MRNLVKLVLTAIVVTVASGAVAQTVGPDAEALARAVREVERLDALRSALAGAFGASGVPADESTFQQVCRPVGQQGQRIAQENGWSFVQMAERYRNPRHRLDADGQRLFRLFADDRNLFGLWMRTELDGQPGMRYLRRIRVEAACLACHGLKDRRPEFVKQRYPDDRAYDFAIGDLRGLYSVFVPDAR